MLIIHSYLRYVVLFFLIASIIKGFRGLRNNLTYTPTDKKLNLLALIFSHIQLAIGLILYFTSETVKLALENISRAMKDKALRFWAVEHISVMIIAITIITMGYSLAKRAPNDGLKFKRIAIFYTVGLILILLAIPWPWSIVARPAF